MTRHDDEGKEGVKNLISYLDFVARVTLIIYKSLG